MIIKIPAQLNFKKKFGLLITDSEVSVVSWEKGNLERLGLFSNDDTGISRFLDFMTKHSAIFKEQAFHVMVNIIGEDYRFEKVAHLIGKYKTDFHSRRMNQLFRGSTLCMSQVQGREERGRREDWVLFSGVLTENKVSPWVSAVSRGDRYVAGVHMVSQLLSDTILSSIGSDTQGNNLVLTIHERGLLRQTFFVNGYLRFSRVSKINDETAESVSASMKKELERTIQYLSSLKMSVGGGLKVTMVSPSNMVGQLRESVGSSERIKFEFKDAAQVGDKIGLKTPIATLGKDSSLPLHVMFSSLRIHQLARLQLITYYWTQLAAKAAILFLVVYGAQAFWGPLSQARTGYFDYAQEAASLEKESTELQRKYDAEVRGIIGEPPSSPENMKAVSNLYSVMENIVISPTQLFYFIGKSLNKNRKIKLVNIEWEVSNTPAPQGDNNAVIVNGKDLYQIARIKGVFEEIGHSETYIDVANRADKLVESFRGRADIHVQVLEIPGRTIATSNLSGSLDSNVDVEAPESREFVLQIVWKEYDTNGFAKIINES